MAKKLLRRARFSLRAAKISIVVHSVFEFLQYFVFDSAHLHLRHSEFLCDFTLSFISEISQKYHFFLALGQVFDEVFKEHFVDVFVLALLGCYFVAKLQIVLAHGCRQRQKIMPGIHGEYDFLCVYLEFLGKSVD